MLHPSYTDLINVVNSDIEPGEQPVVQSRYSIVIAASRRARQIIGGDDPMVAGTAGKKPLSIAIDELYHQKVKILPEDETEDEKENTEGAEAAENAETPENEEAAENAEPAESEESAENEESV